MRSASARAAFTIDSACSRRSCEGCERVLRAGAAEAGSGGSCGNANPSSVALDELFIVVILRAANSERARLLEPADGADDASLRLLDDGAELGRLERDLIQEHLRT